MRIPFCPWRGKSRRTLSPKIGYEADKWPEARFVESYGGEVVALRKLEGYSTSAMPR
ncbi:MAG: hypothetical protein LBD04_07950 [Synergistaceae bacterium]|nr:hypothetical protein [Synergistaceae bacterium]